MADEDVTVDAPTGASKKTAIIVILLLLLEGGALVGAFMFLGGGPQEGDAAPDLELPITSEEDRIVEIEVIDEKLSNNRGGMTFLYDTRIYAQVKRKFEERVNIELEQFRNEIQADLRGIWRSADPRAFEEAKLDTLTRQVEALFGERLGTDLESGEEILKKVVIVLGPGFRVDL